MRLDQIALRCIIIIIREGLGHRNGIIDQVRHRAPLTVAAYQHVHRVGRQFLACYLERVLLCHMHHVYLRVMERLQRTDKGVLRLVIGTELPRSGVLDKVRLAPWVSCRDAGVQSALGRR